MDVAAGDASSTNITPNDRTEFTPDWQPTASTFTVTTASDSGDGVCNSICTLREAITASNATSGSLPNTIRFNIPGSGVQTITPWDDHRRHARQPTEHRSLYRPVLLQPFWQRGQDVPGREEGERRLEAQVVPKDVPAPPPRN
jgi:CSLREA domain-containing protein